MASDVEIAPEREEEVGNEGTKLVVDRPVDNDPVIEGTAAVSLVVLVEDLSTDIEGPVERVPVIMLLRPLVVIPRVKELVRTLF